MVGSGQKPPSQPDLPDMPPVVAMAMQADADGVIPDDYIARLEARGQQRLDV